ARHDFGVFGAAKCRKGSSNFILKTKPTRGFRTALAQRLRTYVQEYRLSGRWGSELLPRKAQLIPLGESAIFRRRCIEEDRKTSVHLLVDVSGSMLSKDDQESSRGELACLSALSLALALEGIDGVKNLCSFFPGLNSELEVALKVDESATAKAAFFDQTPRGSTPLAQALWYALEQLVSLECQRNIVIVITDGIPDSVEKTRQVLEVYREAGVELYGIGIKQPFIEDLIKNSVVLNSAIQLEQCLFKLIDKIFRRFIAPSLA
ncbi:MAG: VWA domain-containing protein, partial [Succinivibrio sp.]|nr:VWA domain-containing protein [Succinivibrio sp.]